ncbi:hypothetical protein [Streptosporangium sp. NPDC001681]|uniref:hypothetical protein n=1 Tax=Streptosporangium sp. NPDC001681 TaxID=3154395 RepID=UPI00331C8795
MSTHDVVIIGGGPAGLGAAVADRWGRDVLHCAYCHAWEVRDKAVGLIGGGAASLHQAQLWRQWTDRVTLFTNPPELERQVTERVLGARRHGLTP